MKNRVLKYLVLITMLVCLLVPLAGCSSQAEAESATSTVTEIVQQVEEKVEDVVSDVTEKISEVISDLTGSDNTDPESSEESGDTRQDKTYTFRNQKLLDQHFEKHGIEMGFATAEEYEAAASAVINNPDALSKKEKEDNDFVYYVEETNEFVILSTDGYIRTYFLPSAGKAYYDRQ